MNSTDTTRKQNGELVDRLSAALPARLHVVVGPEDGTYTAYAIEFDIVGQGETAEAAVDEMFALVREYVRKAIELNEIENLVRPMPRLEILRLKFKVWRSRAETCFGTPPGSQRRRLIVPLSSMSSGLPRSTTREQAQEGEPVALSTEAVQEIAASVPCRCATPVSAATDGLTQRAPAAR